MKIISAADPSHAHIEGIVEDESRNMLIINTGRRTVKVPKEKSSFLLELSKTQYAKVEGSSVRLRPEDRVKRAIGKW